MQRSASPRERWLLAAGALIFLGAVVAAPLTADADSTGSVSPEYQGYSAQGGQDPYASDNPQDVHVDGFGGQPVVTGYVLLDMDSVPFGSNINGLTLVMIPNSSASDNANASAATIEACPLTQPLTSNGFQASPPPYDCGTFSAGEPQTDGSWDFDLAPLASAWTQGKNDGVALLAYAPANGTPAQLSPGAWSVAFDHTKTAASVDYTPPSSNSFGSGTSPSSVPPPPVFGSSGVSGGAGSSGVIPSAGAPAATSPTPSSTPQPSRARHRAAPAVATPAPRGPSQWLWLAVALVGAALVMVVVVASQQALRGGAVSIWSRLGPALAASRSQLATPVAVLTLASVIALGFGGQIASGAGARNSGGSGSNGSGTSGTGSSGPTATPGSSAAGTTGGGGTSAGSGGRGGTSAATVSSTNGGLDGPGVTSTTVRIGFVYVSNGQAANEAFGVHVADVGNEQAEQQVLVNYINAHGGIAGRQIQPVFISFNNAQAETDPTIGEEGCHTFTEDYHVFAVIGGAGPPDDYASNACYAGAGTLNFDLSQAVPDLSSLRQESPYVWATEDSALDRTMRIEVPGLASRGFFSGNPKLGVVIADDPTNEGVYNNITLPALEAAGESSGNIDMEQVPHDTLSNTANTMKQIVARYQLEGITNVFFQGGGIDGTGSFALLFMLDAESQHYNPRYGLSSDDGPVALAQNVPQDQLNGTLVVGTIPEVDTDDAHYGQWPYTPDQKTCASIEAPAFTTTTQEGALAVIAYCDAMFELQEGAQSLTGQPLNAQLWADRAMRLGSNLFNAGMYRRYIGPGHWDAAGGYRLLHAVENCEGSNACFVYDNSTTYSA